MRAGRQGIYGDLLARCIEQSSARLEFLIGMIEDHPARETSDLIDLLLHGETLDDVEQRDGSLFFRHN